MSSGLFDYGKNLVLDVMFGATAFVPEDYWIGLVTEFPSESLNGSTLPEPYWTYGDVGEDPPDEPEEEIDPVDDVPTGYGRVQLPNVSSSWLTAAGGAKRSNASLVFPQADHDWGTIVAVVLTDAETDGNAIAWVELNNPIRVLSGGVPILDPEALVLTATTPVESTD